MTGQVASDMQAAAMAVLDSLDPEQRALLALPFDDPRREAWMYWPREMSGDENSGVPLHAMTFQQRKLVMRLVVSGVDVATYAQVAAIMALDLPLDHLERYRDTELRDPMRYWLTIFGEPAPTGAWSWQFEGHHVAINHVIVDGDVASSTPLFMGANPARVEKGRHVVSRPCGPEEDAGRALLVSLSGESATRAVLAARAPIDLVIHRLPQVPQRLAPGEAPHPLDWFQAEYMKLSVAEREELALDLARPAGVARRDLAAPQRALLDDIVSVYVGRLPGPIARSELARLEEAGLDEIHFVWAGPPDVGAPHYYRLQGPTFLVEYDCVQDGANHVHAVWRDPERDFGRDPLRAHRAAAH
jgi:Protein of unknown function (DUF3500)